MSTANETPICDDQLLAFDETAHDNRCSINMYWYKRIRERLRLAEIGGMEAGQCASCRPALPAEMGQALVRGNLALHTKEVLAHARALYLAQITSPDGMDRDVADDLNDIAAALFEVYGQLRTTALRIHKLADEHEVKA